MKKWRPQFSLGSALLFSLFISALAMAYLGRKSWVLEKTMTFGEKVSKVVLVTPGKSVVTMLMTETSLASNTVQPSSSQYNTLLQVWDIRTGHLLNSFHCPEAIFGITLSYDGKYVLCSGENELYLWESADGNCLKHLKAREPRYDDNIQGCFSGDGTRVYFTNTERGLSMFSTQPTKNDNIVIAPDQSQALYYRPLPNDRGVLAWLREPGSREKIAILNASTLATITEVELKVRGGVALSPSGLRLLVSLMDATQIWDADTLTVLHSVPRMANNPHYFADGKYVCWQPDTGDAEIWDELLQHRVYFRDASSVSIHDARAFSINTPHAKISDLNGECLAQVILPMGVGENPFQVKADEDQFIVSQDNSIICLRRRFPEYWWGHFYRAEVWLAIIFGLWWIVRIWRARTRNGKNAWFYHSTASTSQRLDRR